MKNAQLTLSFPIIKTLPVQPTKAVPLDSYFPEEEANRLAELESYNKHLFRPNTYLHKWWARRSGTTFRYILKQLVPESEKRDYYSSGGLEGITILDPMMGGGTILHESIRLGANAIGYDIDPIPVLQARASLSETPPAEKKQVYLRLEKELENAVAQYYETQCPICRKKALIQFTLYGLRKKHANKEVIVVDSFVLRVESNDEIITLDEFYPSRKVRWNNRTLMLIDKESAREEGINGKSSDLLSIPFTERYVPLVIAGYCENHKNFFRKPGAEDHRRIEAAKKWTKRNVLLVPDEFRIPSGPKSDDLLSRNIHYYYELFFHRQLIYIATCQQLLRSVPNEHKLWLGLLISTSLEFNSALCGYKGAEKRRPGAIRHVFSHHAYSFPYTALENNPLFPRNTSGTLCSLFKSRVESAGEWAGAPVERRFSGSHWDKVVIPNEIDMGHDCSSLEDFPSRSRMYIVRQNDSTHMPLPDQCVDYVVTDPPYFDSVQYSDLSHFFRCWLRTFLPAEANWRYHVKSSAVAETAEGEEKFGSVLGGIWQECYRVLKRPHGRLVFTYHHWNPSAWAQLTISLQKARFVLTNALVVHSENPISVHIMNLRALKHDAILVLKPRGLSERARWSKPNPALTSDSYSFCRSCGEMVGWLLDNNFSEVDIARAWLSFMKG